MSEELGKRVLELEHVVLEIQERNARVERDKGWETSLTRRVCLLILTYLCMALVFWMIDVDRFFANAFIATMGYLLSTLALPVLQKYWESLIQSK